MQAMSEAELLRLYVRDSSESALFELVARQLPLAQAAILRQTDGDPARPSAQLPALA
jgi:hypothetical protein